MSAATTVPRALSVIKLGGSVLTGIPAFTAAAAFVARRQAELGTPLVVVVSAEHGQTDALLELARSLDAAPNPRALDLLWSTGELRSVALLTLALQAQGVRAAAANVHQAGLDAPHSSEDAGTTSVRPLRLLALLDAHDVVVIPGFLARGAGDVVTSLGRGGSDLTAVLVAGALGASLCELVKDVDGYYSADPRVDRRARHLPALDVQQAIAMADAGCGLVQRQALTAAAHHSLPLSVRAMDGSRRTLVSPANPAR